MLMKEKKLDVPRQSFLSTSQNSFQKLLPKQLVEFGWMEEFKLIIELRLAESSDEQKLDYKPLLVAWFIITLSSEIPTHTCNSV